jgi:hypothetical protein
MPKYLVKFEVESNDYCGIFEYGTLANDKVDAIMDSGLPNIEKEWDLGELLTSSEEFKVLEAAVLESAEDEYQKERDEDEDGMSDLSSNSRFRVFLDEVEIKF